MSDITRADVGPPMASCYTGPEVTEGFVFSWIIADFRDKMRNFKTGKKLESSIFHIGETKWRMELYPSGVNRFSDGNCHLV